MVDIQVVKEIRAAIKQEDMSKIHIVLEANPGAVNMITPFGTWLHVASSHGKLSIVKLLINMGADINKRGGMFEGTAINEAANEGSYDIVKYLLSYNAVLDTSEPERNPLFSAIMSGHKDIAQLLIDSGIDASVKYTGDNMKNMDAYDFAIERGQKEIAAMLEPYRK